MTQSSMVPDTGQTKTIHNKIEKQKIVIENLGVSTK